MTEQQYSPYQRLGGEVGVRRLVDRFYDLMDTLPQAQVIRALHPADLTVARDKLFKFLSGWLGGPPLYQQEYGDPRLRARHLPFPIDAQDRDAWMLCMTQALNETDLDPLMREQLRQSLLKTAEHIRNQS